MDTRWNLWTDEEQWFQCPLKKIGPSCYCRYGVLNSPHMTGILKDAGDNVNFLSRKTGFLHGAPNIRVLQEKGDIHGLTRLLQHPDLTVQWKAAEALGTLGPEAVDHLLSVMHKQDLPGRLGAIEALADIRDSRAVKPLVNLLLYDESNEIRWASAIALGEIGDGSAIEPLENALKNRDKYVRYGAAIALRHIGWNPESPEEKARLYIALQDWKQILSLGKGATEPVFEILSDPDPDVRHHAIETLERLHVPVPNELCGQMLRDPVAGVRWQAVIAAKKCHIPVSYLPWAISKRTRVRKSPGAAALLNFLFLGLGYNYLGKWWGFLVFQIYMTTLLMFTLFPVPLVGTYIFLIFLQIPGIPVPFPISLIFAIHAWLLAEKMPDL